MLPSDREKGEFYDIVLGISTKNLRVNDIESILLRIEQKRSSYEGFECEVSYTYSNSIFSSETCVIIKYNFNILFNLLTLFCLHC